MVLPTSLPESWRVFFPIDSKEEKLIIPLVVSRKLYLDFHKDQFRVPYFSIPISMTYVFFDIIECGIASYAADNTSYNFDFSLDMEVVKSLSCLHDLDNVISNVEKIY